MEHSQELYLLYLFLGLSWLFKKRDEEDVIVKEKETVIIKEKETIIVKEEPKVEEVKVETINEVEEVLEEDDSYLFEDISEVEDDDEDIDVPLVGAPKSNRIIYNYSFRARLHMADSLTVERFNEIKNYVLSYEGVTVNKTWVQETFIFKNTSIFKVRVNGKTTNLFYNLDPKEFKDTKYKLVDRSDVKTHEATPGQYQITGPRKMEWAKELIDLYMERNGGVKLKEYQEEDYKVKPISMEKLIEVGLIKVSALNKEYAKIIE